MNIYTDGACSGNHTFEKDRKAGIGIVMVDEGEVVWDYGCDVTTKIKPEVTNNRAELYAILVALKTFIEECKGFDNVILHTDSKYSVNIFNTWLKGWKQSGKGYKNMDLIDKIDMYIDIIRESGINLVIQHIRGHSVNKYNNIADKLAVESIIRSSYVA